MTTSTWPTATAAPRWSPPTAFAWLDGRKQALVAVLMVLGVLGLGLRFWLADNSIGCDDADIWLEHADFVKQHGVLYAYEHPGEETLQFNHPPLMGYYASFARKLTNPSVVRFSFWMKLPGLLGEVLSAFLIWSIWSKKNAVTAAAAFAAYGTCPTLILVSGFHCQTDPAYAALTLLSFYLLCDRRSPFLAGLAMAAALNVKILPVLLIPPLLVQCRSWRQAIRFSLGASLAIVPLLPFLIAAPHDVFRNMVSYNSQQLDWGIYALLYYTDHEALLGGALARVTHTFVHSGRYLIIAAIVATSIHAAFRPHRFRHPYRLGASVWALFLVLTPGFGVQYTVAVLPLLFATNVRRAVVYGVLAAIMLVFIYATRLKLVLPLHGMVQYYPWPHSAIIFGLLAWMVLLGFLVSTLRRQPAHAS